MAWYAKKANEMTLRVIQDDRSQAYHDRLPGAEEEDANLLPMYVKHIRQDMIGIYSLLGSVNYQLQRIIHLLYITVGLLFFFVVVK
jgi:hypothetical protein